MFWLLSKFDITVEPVVVIPDMLSKKASLIERSKVENINGPIILISGKNDQIWPSEKMCNQIVDRLKKNNFKHDFKHVALDTDHYLFFSEKEIVDIIVNNFKEFFGLKYLG